MTYKRFGGMSSSEISCQKYCFPIDREMKWASKLKSDIFLMNVRMNRGLTLYFITIFKLRKDWYQSKTQWGEPTFHQHFFNELNKMQNHLRPGFTQRSWQWSTKLFPGKYCRRRHIYNAISIVMWLTSELFTMEPPYLPFKMT